MRILLLCLLLTMPATSAAMPVARPAAMPLGNGADRVAIGVARMVGSILEFAHWPEGRQPLRLCVAGVLAHGDRLGEITLGNGVRLSLLPSSSDAIPVPMQCDALYFGRMDASVERRLIGAMRGNAVVTIAEDDPDCSSGAMFCLLFEPQALSFQLNIDAVSRSTVRIDPRVLRLAKGGY